MALGVIGDVHESSADRRRQLLAAHSAKGIEVRGGQHPHAIGGIAEGRFHLSQQLRERLAARLLRLQERQLIRGDLAALRVGQQAVGGARNMFQVKRNGGQSQRLRKYLEIASGLRSTW